MSNEHIRRILKRKGFRDENIGWDQDQRQVTIRGRPFDFPGEVQDGRFMTTEEDVRRTLGGGLPAQQGVPGATGQDAQSLNRLVQQIYGQRPEGTQIPEPETEREFTLDEVRALADQIGQVGGEVQPQFQDPEQLVNLITTMQEQMQPAVDQRQEAAMREGREMLHGLEQDWARRGMGASGAAAAAERGAMGDITHLLDQIQAEAHADAIPLALQQAQLMTDETARARDFELQRAMGAADPIMQGLGQQEQMRRWEQEMGLTAQEMDQRAQQQWMDQLLRGTTAAADHDLRDRQLQEQMRQFDETLPLEEAQLTGMYEGDPTLQMQQFLENVRQFEQNFGLREGELLGQYMGQPTMDAQQMAQQDHQFQQELGLRQGQMAMDQQNQMVNAIMGMAGMTGEIPEAASGMFEGTPMEGMMDEIAGSKTMEYQELTGMAANDPEVIAKAEDLEEDYGLSNLTANALASDLLGPIGSMAMTADEEDEFMANAESMIDNYAMQFQNEGLMHEASSIMAERDNILRVIESEFGDEVGMASEEALDDYTELGGLLGLFQGAGQMIGMDPERTEGLMEGDIGRLEYLMETPIPQLLQTLLVGGQEE